MTTVRYVLVVSMFALAMSSAAAFACTYPTPIDFDATREPADVVFEGTASKVGITDRKVSATIDVSDLHFGSFPEKQFRLEWRIPEGGMCAPQGPIDIKAGDKLRVYLRKIGEDQHRAIAWEYIELYPKTREVIALEQGVAQFRQFRSNGYFNVGGGLSLNNPKTWLPADWIGQKDLHELQKTIFSVSVNFAVDWQGQITDCQSGHVADFKFAYLDKKACETISKNAKLIPPVFTEETRGSFVWSPPLQ
jgi:hypothetical protein